MLDQHNFLAHYAIVVFGHSRFLGDTLIQNPDLLASFLREKNLDRSFSQEEFHESLARFRARSSESDVALTLARFKRREYVRIMLRDVLKIAPLAETTAEISALADVLIEAALREADSKLQRRHGTPQHLDALGTVGGYAVRRPCIGQAGGQRAELQLGCGPYVHLRRRRGAAPDAGFQSRIFHSAGTAHDGNPFTGHAGRCGVSD